MGFCGQTKVEIDDGRLKIKKKRSGNSNSKIQITITQVPENRTLLDFDSTYLYPLPSRR